MTTQRRSSPPGEPRLVGYLYILPAAAIFAFFVIYPLTQGAWLSFWHWDGLGPAIWAGIDNYTEILADESLSLGVRPFVVSDAVLYGRPDRGSACSWP